MKKFGFGLMRLPLLDSNDQTSIDIETVKVMADKFLASGFTYFDTASCYHNGHSEIAFREAVAKRYPRDSYTITDKLSLFMIRDGEAGFQPFFEEQLRRLGVDYMDYYLIHTLDRNSFRHAEENHAFEFISRLKAEGRVKHIGFSFHDKAFVLDEILGKHPEIEFVQLQINYLDWEDHNVESHRCYEVAKKHGKPVIVMEPVKGGSLVNVPAAAKKLFTEYNPGLSVASWAIRFAASLGSVVMVLSGMSNIEQVDDNLSYMKDFRPLSSEEEAVIGEAREIIVESVTVPCTACRYCVEDCPKKIAIPEYFKLYNDLKRIGAEHGEAVKAEYAELTKTHGKASECVKCGKCEEHCPQHLDIRKFLEAVAGNVERL